MLDALCGYCCNLFCNWASTVGLYGGVADAFRFKSIPEAIVVSVDERILLVSKAENDSPTFSHIDETGQARMVNVGAKGVTERRALAEAWVILGTELVARLRKGGGAPKAMYWIRLVLRVSWAPSRSRN